MRLLLFLLLPALGFAQTGFRAEFNYLVPDTPVEGGDYRLRGLYADGDALGFPVDSVTAGKFFYDAKGRLYEIVYSNAAQPLTIEVDTVGHSFAPTLGIGLLTDRTVNIFLPFETSKIAGKLRSIVEVETRKLIDFNSGVEVDKLADLLDVDTTGLGNSYIVRYVADSAKWYVFENNIDGLSDATFDTVQGNLGIGTTKQIPFLPGPENKGNLMIGRAVFDSLKYGQENLGISVGVAFSADTLFRSIGVGKNSMGGYTHTQGIYHTKATESVYFGLFSGGMDSLSFRSTQVGTYTNEGVGTEKRININGVLLGYAAKSLQDSSVNEIVIGAGATGNGSNTATLGNNNITGTYLKGNINLRGYGAGNKESADLSKTRSRYLAAFATDGTLIELDTAGLFGGASGASSFVDLNDIDTTGLQDNYAFRYNSSTGLFEAKANNIDGLDDGYYKTGNLGFPITDTIIDYNQTVIGWGTISTLVSGGGNTTLGAETMRFSTAASQNTVIGRQAGKKLNGSDNVLMGKEAGYISSGSETELTLDFTDGVFLGQAAWAKDTISTNEIVIGSKTTGNGSNTATLGNNNITATYLKGTTNLRGYGAGNKEAADLSKNATDYVLRPASDGTILEQVNDIDGLVDGRSYDSFLLLGVTNTLNNTGSFNTIVSKNTSNQFVDLTGEGNSIFGYNAGANLKTGNLNTLSGRSAGVNLIQGGKNTISGALAAHGNVNGSQNVLSGYLVNSLDTIGANNVIMGAYANSQVSFLGNEVILPINYGKSNSDSVVVIGAFAKTLNPISTNEIVLGAFTTGNGSNTATLGNNNITATYLKGTTNLRGYGAGNKEAADLGKTASAYIAGYATDGTLIELPSSGLGISLTDLSVTQNSPGTAGLTYNNTNGVFTYTPPDLSSYLTTEVDGSVTNEIQDLSLTGNVLSLSGDATTVDLTESVQDEINNTITAGEGISVVYDDGAGTLTISAPSGAGNTDEQTLSINNSTAELSISNGNTVDLSEAIDNQVNNLFVDGTNILSTYDDISNTLTVRTTDALTQIDAISFDNNVTDAVTGRLQYDQDKGTLKFGLANNTPIYLGTDMGWYVKNQSGSSIAKGTPVYVSGTDGSSGRKLISPMIADGSINAKLFLGITAETIANGGDGLVLDHGGIKGVNLSGFSANDVLYVSPTVAGTLVNTEPTAPNLKLPIGYVVNNASNGSLSIRSTVGTYLSENHDVQIASATNGDVLKFDGSKWVDGTDLVDDADADATNEIQTISLVGNDLTLSNSGGTVTLPSYTSESTTASNGLTLSGSDVKLGGTLTETTTINLGGTYSFNISESGSNTLFKVFNDLIEARGVLYQHDGVVRFGDYGLGSIDPSPTQTASDYLLGLTTDGTLIEVDKTAFTQDLSLTGNTLSLSGDATTVDLSGYLDNTDAQAISLTSNTLSITGNASTVDLSGYLDDQTVSLTGAGITAISGTYPNFTITSTEVDGSVTNEGQLSASTVISGTTARLTSNTGGGSNVDYVAGTGLAVSSSGGNTITYTNTLPEATTASNGLTETGTDVRLGGVLTQDVLIGLSTFDFIVGQDDVSMQMYPGDGTVFDGLLRFLDYGSGNKEASDLSKTKSNYKAAFATDGTLIEVDDIDAMVVACSDETTDITTGTAKVTFRAPHAMTITGVRASLTTASSSGNPTVDINEGGTSILGTKLTIDANEKTSTTAATAATITDTAIADDAEITIDIDAAGTGATGLKVTILYRKN